MEAVGFISNVIGNPVHLIANPAPPTADAAMVGIRSKGGKALIEENYTGTTLLDLPPIVIKLILSRIPSAQDVRALLRCCHSIMNFVEDTDVLTAWLVRHARNSAVLLSARAKRPAVALQLLELGLPANAVDPRDQRTALHWACRGPSSGVPTEASVKLVHCLLHQGKWQQRAPFANKIQPCHIQDSGKVDVCARSEAGNTALHEAALTRNRSAVKLLTKTVPKIVLTVNAEGLTALGVACSEDVMLTLLHHMRHLREHVCKHMRGDVHRALMQAWFRAFDYKSASEVLKALIATYKVAEKGTDLHIDPQIKNKDGDAAIHLACETGDAMALRLLLAAYPDLDLSITDAEGRCAWHLVPYRAAHMVVLLQKAEERQNGVEGGMDEEDDFLVSKYGP